MYKNSKLGIKQLEGFDAFENDYISKYYPLFDITRTVVLYGSDDIKNPIGKISFCINCKR
jgi:pantothenate kinase-related protein Tda10